MNFGVCFFRFVISLQQHWPIFPYASVDWVNIGSDNGLPPVRYQTIIWTNVDLYSIGTIFSEIRKKLQDLSFKKMPLKMSSANWQQFCPGSAKWNQFITELVCNFFSSFVSTGRYQACVVFHFPRWLICLQLGHGRVIRGWSTQKEMLLLIHTQNSVTVHLHCVSERGTRGVTTYRKLSNIRRTKSENLSGCRLVLQLSLANPLKPGIKLRMKM